MIRYRKIFEQTLPEDSYYKISPEDYLNLMLFSGYNGKGISKLPRFKGKPLWITGGLNLSNTPTEHLGNVGYIEGKLDISGTKISDLGDIVVKSYVSDWNTPLRVKRDAARQRAKANEMDGYRESDDWNLNNPDIDDLGLKANALFEYLVGNGDLESLSDEEQERVDELRSQITELETQRQNLSTDDEDWDEKDDELQEQIYDLEQELEDLVDDKSDVYVLYPVGEHYGLQTFENLSSKDTEYAVGTEDEMDDAALEYAKNLIDDGGIEGIDKSFLEDYIDIDYLVSYFEDSWRDDIYENPEVYFSEDDFELSPEQERRISEIESEIEDYENQQSELDSDREDYDELYDDFQEKIDELESEKDEIVPDTEPTDEMIENVLEDRLDDVKRNPMYYIRDYVLNIENYIDKDGLAKGIVEADGYGIVSNYDGSYDTMDIQGETYYIFRIS
jgi:predicted nuclease with TOPRIM domain